MMNPSHRAGLNFLLTALIVCITTVVFSQDKGGTKTLSPSEPVLDSQYYQSVDQAIRVHEKVLRYYDEKFGFDSAESLDAVEALAWLNIQQQNYKNAEMFYRRAVRVRNSKISPSPENKEKLFTNYYLLGDAYMYQGLYKEAEIFYDEAVRLAVSPESMGDVIKRKGYVHEQLGAYERAVDFYAHSLQKYEQARAAAQSDTSKMNIKVLNVYFSMSGVYQKMKNDIKYHETEKIIQEWRERYSL